MKDIAEVFLFVIAALSGLICHEFYISRDGRLRILIIRLFMTKIWVYGGAAIAYLFEFPIDPWLLRVVLNAPMFIVMLQLWGYIRTHNK